MYIYIGNFIYIYYIYMYIYTWNDIYISLSLTVSLSQYIYVYIYIDIHHPLPERACLRLHLQSNNTFQSFGLESAIAGMPSPAVCKLPTQQMYLALLHHLKDIGLGPHRAHSILAPTPKYLFLLASMGTNKLQWASMDFNGLRNASERPITATYQCHVM